VVEVEDAIEDIDDSKLDRPKGYGSIKTLQIMILQLF
jgi:hypothetical protein